MDLEPGKPVFLEDTVSQGRSMVGQTVRVTGTLHSFNATLDRAILIDNQYLLVIDTSMLGVIKYYFGQTYQFIGVVTPANPPDEQQLISGDLEDGSKYNLEIVVKARVARDVDGLDMEVYRKSVVVLRAFLDKVQPV
ncbi:hypothetical protein FBU59_000282 [Linderina macrospora]|uniref:Uncharacterized protein n=1 Tax=Linderina macrospora TaxID=4868 RepID=A0ACC1JH25_9FUNG|nr:hypothetical protein FBU59_000282 [Linderina macrospora]